MQRRKRNRRSWKFDRRRQREPAVDFLTLSRQDDLLLRPTILIQFQELRYPTSHQLVTSNNPIRLGVWVPPQHERHIAAVDDGNLVPGIRHGWQLSTMSRCVPSSSGLAFFLPCCLTVVRKGNSNTSTPITRRRENSRGTQLYLHAFVPA